MRIRSNQSKALWKMLSTQQAQGDARAYVRDVCAHSNSWYMNSIMVGILETKNSQGIFGEAQVSCVPSYLPVPGFDNGGKEEVNTVKVNSLPRTWTQFLKKSSQAPYTFKAAFPAPKEESTAVYHTIT